MKPYSEFCAAVRKRESSNNYKAKNTLGYLGAYQFGRARLTDLGICRRIKGTKGFANASFEFVPPLTEELWLANPVAQDQAFDRHVADLKRRILSKYGKTDFEANGLKFSLSGAIGVCHLLGLGGLQKLLEGSDDADAYGTKGSDYARLFDGYLIEV